MVIYRRASAVRPPTTRRPSGCQITPGPQSARYGCAAREPARNPSDSTTTADRYDCQLAARTRRYPSELRAMSDALPAGRARQKGGGYRDIAGLRHFALSACHAAGRCPRQAASGPPTSDEAATVKAPCAHPADASSDDGPVGDKLATACLILAGDPPARPPPTPAPGVSSPSCTTAYRSSASGRPTKEETTTTTSTSESDRIWSRVAQRPGR